MAYFPNKQSVKTELQEHVNKFDLSCDILTTANFNEPNIAYIRDNTTREKWKSNEQIFARPTPLIMPVMGRAKLCLKTYFVPYRTLSPQWHDFITHSPRVTANANTATLIQEMPYFKMASLRNLFITAKYSDIVTSGGVWDFKTSGGAYKLTAWGRHCMKILHQLRYKVIFGAGKEAKHYNALRILAFAKVFSDFYESSQYANAIAGSIAVNKLFNKDNTTAYELTQQDFDNIFEYTRTTFYDDDYFVSQWDNPVSPNSVGTSFGNITIEDITATGYNLNRKPAVDTNNPNQGNEYNTPYLIPGYLTLTGNQTRSVITQYAIDSLKKCTDYLHRYAISGVRAVDRYLARFGVLLTSEKMKRSEYIGKQETEMQFGAVYSTAQTGSANVGDYAGQGIINSENGEHNTFELDDLQDMGCIIQIFTIKPKIGYCQGIDRNNLRSDPESYFNGIFDSLGTQATSAAEVYISEDGTSQYGSEDIVDHIFGFIARGAHNKLALDNLSGDFMFNSMNNGDYKTSPWHMFRLFDDTYFDDGGLGLTHSPWFAGTYDSEQYLRIFNDVKEDDGDHFIVFIQHAIESNIHAKPIYDTYDFESEGKKIIMDGLGPKQN